MKKIKAHIKTSPDKDLIYNIYRSTNDEPLPDTVDLLGVKAPIMIVDESKIVTSALMVFEEESSMNVSAILEDNLIPYTIGHIALRDMIHHIIVKIDYNNDSSKHYSIEFNNAHDIVLVKDQDGIEYDASSSVVVNSGTVIKIHEDLLVDSIKVSTSYYTEVFEVIDANVEQTGVTYNGPVALGLNPAKLNKESNTVKPTVTVNIPYLKFNPILDLSPITYNYRIIAKDSANNVSDPSDVISLSMVQSTGTVNYSLEHCRYNDTLKVEEQNWIDTSIFLSEIDNFEFGKFGTENFTKYGSIFETDIIPGIKVPSIASSYSASPTASVTILCDNPWHVAEYTDRKTKAFRLKGHIIGEHDKFIYSNIIDSETLKVGIDQVIVRRKEVFDSLTDNVPAEIDGDDADTVASFIKFNGLKYTELNSTTPSVLDASTLDTASFQAPIVHSLMTDSSGKNQLSIIDTNVVNGKLYRYTFYIKDDMGLISTGSSVDVPCI